MINFPDSDFNVARDILNEKIRKEDLRLILKNLLQVDKLSEDEISAEYIDEPADFLVLYFGLDLLSKQKIREALVRRLAESGRADLVKLHDDLGYESLDRPTDLERLIAKTSLDKWFSGGRKSLRFTNFFKFPERFSGIKRKGSKLEPYEEIRARVPWGTLHDYQEILLHKMDDWYGNESYTNSGMLVMPTGTGKTRVAASLIINNIKQRYKSGSEVDFTILWIAHTKELIEQAYETFRNMWVNEGVPRRSLKLTRFYDTVDVGELLDSWGIVVCSIQKLHESIKNPESQSAKVIKQRLVNRGKLRLVAIDEAHRADNPSYREVLDFLSKKDTFSPIEDNGWKLLGLTATPFTSEHVRTKKLNQMFQEKFKLSVNDPLPSIRKYGVYEWFKKERYMSHNPRYISVILPESSFSLKPSEKKHFRNWQNLPSSTLSRLALNSTRNGYILNVIKETINEKGSKKILLFACSVPHCYLLHALLTSQGIDSRFVVGAMTRRERDENIIWFRESDENRPVVLINFHILTTGFDDPMIDTVFITRPTGSKVLYHQMIGRGLRGEKNGGNKGGSCWIYDVKDNFEEFDGFRIINYDNEIAEMSDY